MKSLLIRMGILALLAVPLPVQAQGDPAAFAEAYDKCMAQKPKYATRCYRHTCFYQGCVAQHSSRLIGGAVTITDPAMKQAATVNCTPHIQALDKCNKEHGIINVPVNADADEPKGGPTTRLSCKSEENEEKGCCCFKGAHTYRFEPQQVGSATVTFDTGKRIDCKSTVSIDALVGETWEKVSSFSANSSSGGSEVAPRTVSVEIGKVIGGLRIGDGCVCCIDDSRITLH